MKARPVLVVQNDVGNAYSSETIVVALRDRHGGGMLPIFVPVAKGVCGLAKDSVVDAGHMNTVAKEQLGQFLGSLPKTVMCSVDQALRVSLALI
jgi:mRNA interferase MazF